jgi:hypothetical protein
MRTDIVVASGQIAGSFLGAGGTIAASATIVPLAPILVTGGILINVPLNYWFSCSGVDPG